MKPHVRLRFAAGFDAAPIPGIGDADYAAVEKSSGIRHSRHYGHSACLVAATAKKLAELPDHSSDKLGLICNGGPIALHAAWSMLDRARSAGAAFVNPLQFPPTLISAGVTSAAAAVGAHAFAYAVGHDHFAYFHVLLRSAQAVRLSFAKQVFAIAIIGRDPSLITAAVHANRAFRADVALGFRVDMGAEESGDLVLLDSGTHDIMTEAWPDATRYEAVWENGTLGCSWDPLFADNNFLGATGGVLLHLAARRHEALQPSIRNNAFLISLKTEKASMAVVLRFHALNA